MTFKDSIKNISTAVKTGETAYFWNHEGSYYDALTSVWKNMPVPVQREVMCIIERFAKDATPDKSPSTKKCFVSRSFFSLDEISKIKICHMVAKELPEVIEGMQSLIAVDVLDYEDAAEDAFISHAGDASDE